MNGLYTLYQAAIGNPKTRWIVILLTIIYLFSPLDALPEMFLFIFGYLDDGILLSLLVSELTKLNRKNQQRKAEEVTFIRKN